ncbi:MAG: hypothetical protein R3320_09180 [Nitriliruptorales bacterium]|nr:hypothetical protein [Nitriliruptorales bacterium]
MSTDDTVEKVKGLAKEVAGKATGSDELAREGEEQQKKAQKQEEAERLEEAARQKKQEAAGHASQESQHQGT